MLHDIIRVLGKQKVVVFQHFCPVWTGDVFNSSFDESFLGERAKRPGRPARPMGYVEKCLVTRSASVVGIQIILPVQ